MATHMLLTALTAANLGLLCYQSVQPPVAVTCPP